MASGRGAGMRDYPSVKNYSARLRETANCLATLDAGARRSRSGSSSFHFDMERQLEKRSRVMQVETVETVETSATGSSTSLKRGVNERSTYSWMNYSGWVYCVC